MNCRIAELRAREVVNIRDGLRLGFVCDAALDVSGGRLIHLIVPGKYRFFGFLGREDDYVIPWECIRRIGDDIILIDVEGEYRREKSRKHTF